MMPLTIVTEGVGKAACELLLLVVYGCPSGGVLAYTTLHYLQLHIVSLSALHPWPLNRRQRCAVFERMWYPCCVSGECVCCVWLMASRRSKIAKLVKMLENSLKPSKTHKHLPPTTTTSLTALHLS